MENKILEMAAKQVLCELLGFEEGLFYYGLISKNKVLHSHTKEYKLLKNLFEQGVLAKIKSDRDSFSYIPLPPNFTHLSVSDLNLSNFLEEIYKKNYPDILVNQFVELSLKGSFDASLTFFMLKNLMKDYALIVYGGNNNFEKYKKCIEKDILKKVIFICRKDYSKNPSKEILLANPNLILNKRIIIIDGRIMIDLLKLPQIKSENPSYIGYLISTDKEDKKMEYIKENEKRLRELFKID